MLVYPEPITPTILGSSIHRSAWKGNSANFALIGFSEIRQKRSGPSPYWLRKDRPFAGYAPLAPPLSYRCYVCRGAGLFPSSAPQRGYQGRNGERG